MIRQSTSTIIMTPPDHFGFNIQTAKTYPFQHAPDKNAKSIRTLALSEFSKMVKTLRQKGILVYLLPNQPGVNTPDAVFLNNWLSHHIDNKLVLYPIQSLSRRSEKQKDALVSIFAKVGTATPKIIDLSNYEKKNLFLESTGSM